MAATTSTSSGGSSAAVGGASEQTQSGRFDHYGYHPKWVWIAPQSRDGRPAEGATTTWWWVWIASLFSACCCCCSSLACSLAAPVLRRVDSGLIQTWHKSHSGVYFNFYVNINYERQGMTQRDIGPRQAMFNIANFRGFPSLFSILKWELMCLTVGKDRVERFSYKV